LSFDLEYQVLVLDLEDHVLGSQVINIGVYFSVS